MVIRCVDIKNICVFEILSVYAVWSSGLWAGGNDEAWPESSYEKCREWENLEEKPAAVSASLCLFLRLWEDCPWALPASWLGKSMGQHSLLVWPSVWRE